MDETIRARPASVRRPGSFSPRRLVHLVALTLFVAFVVGNAVAIVWIWIANQNLPIHTTAEATSRIGGLTGLLGAYLALVQVVLMSRLPWLETVGGFDRLSVWHRWNGYTVLVLVVAHTLLDVYGYGLQIHTGFLDEFWKLIGTNSFPGMVTATIGTGLFVVVAGTSVAIVRRRLPYELWYAVHLSAYAAIALAWFHEIPVGGDITPVFHPRVATYWRVLFFGTIALAGLRALVPVYRALRYRLRVTEVIAETPDVTSIRISGRSLDRLHARPGQFLIWRFLARGHWWSAHPFSLSAAPDGKSFRISAKALGDHTRRMRSLPIGTRVVFDGPFGAFTEDARRRDKALLIAGGIGITPVRSLAETMTGDVVILYRVMSETDIVFADELAHLADARGLTVLYVVGDHASPEGRDLLSPAHLGDLVPDIAERDVFLCGPPAMVDAIRRNVRRAGVSRRQLHIERFAL